VLAAPERSTDSTEDAAAVHANRRRAVALCVAPWLVVGVVVVAVLAAAGLALVGLCVFVGVSAVGSFALWWRAPVVVTDAVGARACGEDEQPRVYNLVEGLCATMGLPVPDVRVVDSPVPNAMAVGRDPRSAVVVVTSGLAESLTLVQLEGVLANELVHVKRHDTLLGAVAVCVALPWALVKGTAAGAATVHRLVGRGREFAADERAVAIVRYPPGLGSALGSMVEHPRGSSAWPPGSGRTAALTRWLWIDPLAGSASPEPIEGNLDDTRVRAAALSLL
jgi:Zn-dependent protease with chaperone function